MRECGTERASGFSVRQAEMMQDMLDQLIEVAVRNLRGAGEGVVRDFAEELVDWLALMKQDVTRSTAREKADG
jgi:hypothetical protein